LYLVIVGWLLVMDRGVALSAQRHQISQVFIENAGVCLVMDVGSAALITALTYVVVSLKYVLSALLPERCAKVPMIGRAGIEGAHTVHFQKQAVDREQIGIAILHVACRVS
jgi:hypothetical protein